MSVGLIDCNNFFVSCERVFRPDLEKKPVMVLSSNDSCVISRSNEVKKLGVPMGAPIFKYKNIIKENKIVLFSANFDLYTEFSARIMSLLKRWFYIVELYSIDEAFVEGEKLNLKSGMETVSKLHRQIGIPVTFGIGPNKTLAKLACEYGKQSKQRAVLIDKVNLQSVLQKMLLEDVWGIGRQNSAKLKSYGIKTALDLCKRDERWVRRLLGINGLKTVLELKGEKVFSLETTKEAQKSIMASRSFGMSTNSKDDLKQAIQTFTWMVVKRMQNQGLHCKGVEVFVISKGAYLNEEAWLDKASDSYKLILNKAFIALDKIYHPLVYYKKAGVRLLGLQKSKYKQINLFEDQTLIDKENKLKQVERSMQEINARWGKDTIKEANFLLPAKWKNKAQYKSPNYLSNWEDIAKVW